MTVNLNGKKFDWEGHDIYPGEKPRIVNDTVIAWVIVILGFVACVVWFQGGWALMTKILPWAHL